MNGAVPRQLLVQKVTHSCLKTLFEKRGIVQRYHCGIQQYARHTGEGKGHRRFLVVWHQIANVIRSSMHSNAYANNAMAKSSKWMIRTVLKGTVRQTTINRQILKPIWKMSSNTCNIPEATGKQPLKEGELKCYECGQKGHMSPQCPKLRSLLRTDPHKNLIRNQDVAGASEGDINIPWFWLDGRTRLQLMCCAHR